MNISNRGLNLIRHFEGMWLTAKPDPIGIPTLGYGTIVYPNGKKVQNGDVCTVEQANDWLMIEVKQKEDAVKRLTPSVVLNQGQFDALVSFVYNVGEGSLKRSTLLKKVLINPNDPTIEREFLKFNKAGNIPFIGLTRRRMSESHLYKTGKLLFFEN